MTDHQQFGSTQHEQQLHDAINAVSDVTTTTPDSSAEGDLLATAAAVEHHLHHDEQQHDKLSASTAAPQPSAPPADDNGYILVPPTTGDAVEKVLDSLLHKPEDIGSLLETLGKETDRALKNNAAAVVAEADSSTTPSAAKAASSVEESKPPQQTPKCGKDKSECASCPYYPLVLQKLCQIEVSPKVKDLLTWTDPKYTGAVFGSTLILLLSLASFSLLTVVSTALLLASTIIGSYRLYLTILFRIKGTYDNTFDKLAKFDVSLPKDKVNELARLLETDVNKVLNKLKSILLWENVATSALAFLALYFVYSLGSVFNTLTLIIIAHIELFTLPKVYQIYKKQIDSALEQASNSVHAVIKQAMQKFPFLNKKKVQ